MQTSGMFCNLDTCGERGIEAVDHNTTCTQFLSFSLCHNDTQLSQVTSSTSKLNIKLYNVEYRDGIKSKGDKIGMPCTHITVI